MKDLHNNVVPKVSNKWYQLGIQLFNEAQLPKLDEIRANYSSDHREGCVEMFKYWLDVTPGATWDDIIHALQAPGLELLSIADNLGKKFKSECMYIRVLTA